MKNSKINLAIANHTSKFLVQSSLLILALLLFLTSNMQAANDDTARLENEKLSPAAMVDPYFSNIISKIKMGHFFNATVSTLNEKTKR